MECMSKTRNRIISNRQSPSPFGPWTSPTQNGMTTTRGGGKRKGKEENGWI
jgi:hypothetical protein